MEHADFADFERHPAPNEKYERQYKEGNENLRSFTLQDMINLGIR